MFADHSTLFRAIFVITILLHGAVVSFINGCYRAKDIDGRSALQVIVWTTIIALLIIGLLFLINS